MTPQGSEFFMGKKRDGHLLVSDAFAGWGRSIDRRVETRFRKLETRLKSIGTGFARAATLIGGAFSFF